MFDEEKRLLLVETGCSSIEKLLKEEIDKVTAELTDKRNKLEELKKLNTEKGTTIREITKQILGNISFNLSN